MPQQKGPWDNYVQTLDTGPWAKYSKGTSDLVAAPVDTRTAFEQDKPWVSPTNPLYPVAEGARQSLHQTAETLKGVPQVITSLPGMVKTGLDFTLGNYEEFAQDLKGAAQGAAQPFVTAGKEAGALVAPSKVNTPSQQEMDEASQGAGANAAGLALGEFATKKLGGLMKGQPQFDPSLPKNNLESAPKYRQQLAEVHGSEGSYELKSKLENKVIPNIEGDLKQSELELFNRPVKNTLEHFEILKHTGKKIWDEYKPYLDQGSTISGDEVVKRANANYDSSVKANHPEEYAIFQQKVNDAFAGQNLSPEEAQHRLTQLNAEAKGFYSTVESAGKAAKEKLVGAQKFLATADALRSSLDEHLPEGAAKVRERYGNVAELMDDMPAPSEAGKPLLKAIFSNSAQAMSTRPGYALARGAMRAINRVSTDSLIRKAYAEMPYIGDPKTAPVATLTHPLTAEKQVVPRGPATVVPQATPAQQPHPMSPRVMLQGQHPLTVSPHPLNTPQINTGLSLGGGVPASAPMPAMPAQLPNINQRIPQLPIENSNLGGGPKPQGLPASLPINQRVPNLPNENGLSGGGLRTHPMEALPNVNQNNSPLPNQIQSGIPSSKRPALPSELPIQQNRPVIAGQDATRAPQTPLTHPLAGQLSDLSPQSTRALAEQAVGQMGHDSADVRYNSAPAKLPVSQLPLTQPPPKPLTPHEQALKMYMDNIKTGIKKK